MSDRGAKIEESAQLELFPVAIGEYDHHESLDVAAQVERVKKLLSEFGAEEVLWNVPMHERGLDAINERLTVWGDAPCLRDTLLYWLGHGWSDGECAFLAHAKSPKEVRNSGLEPDRFARAVNNRQRRDADGERWAIVVVEACRSRDFIDLVQKTIMTNRVLLIGTSGHGATTLGRFADALETCLSVHFPTDNKIELWDLVKELDCLLVLHDGLVLPRALGHAALQRRRLPMAGNINAPLDILVELKAVIDTLADDERHHFVAKAQGAEQCELMWFFEGRGVERRQIVDWLRSASSGLLVVTGRAGCGKSALLGHVLVHSLPELRSTLVKAELIGALPPEELPPDSVFDGVIHLTGLTVPALVQRLAGAAGVGKPPRQEDENEVDWLVKAIESHSRTFTVLADALDEAQDPLAISGVLRRLATVPSVRVVVGTRASTLEGPDHPETKDENLLVALGTKKEDFRGQKVVLTPDPGAVMRYVRKRLKPLTDARKQEQLKAGATITTDDVERAAKIAKNQGFLFARLAVHEIQARPELLQSARVEELKTLLAGSHRDLFATSMRRLTDRSPVFGPLLEALALACGRGLPSREGVWRTLAGAIAGGIAVTDADATAVVKEAAPYLMVDVEDDQSVYRLAHRTFQEYFIQRLTEVIHGKSKLAARHGQIVTTLVKVVENADGEKCNPYIVRHLSRHVAEADAWQLLAEHPDVLDRLDPDAVAANAFRTAFGRSDLPDEIAGVLGAHHLLRGIAPKDRFCVRQLSTARHTIRNELGRASRANVAWPVRWARFRRDPLHLSLIGHEDWVRALATVSLADGRVLLASAGNDHTVRMWDPTTGTAVDPPLTGHRDCVNALAAVPLGAGRVLLASADHDGTVRLWDPNTGAAVGPPLTGHGDCVNALAAVPLADGRVLLAYAGREGTVLLWDPNTRAAVDLPPIDHESTVTALAVVPLADGRVLLASASRDRTVQLWDPNTGAAVGLPLTGHGDWVNALAAVPIRAGRALLASAGRDGTVLLWDPNTRAAVDSPLIDHKCSVNALVAVPLADGRTLLASAGDDRKVRLWDPNTGAAVGPPLTGHESSVSALAAVPLGAGWVLLASADHDGKVLLWDPNTGTAVDPPLTGYESSSNALAAVPLGAGRVLLASAGDDRKVRLWDPNTGAAVGPPLTGHESSVNALAAVPIGAGRMVLASAGDDRTVQLWDPNTGAAVGLPPIEHETTVNALAAVPLADGRVLLASASGTAVKHDRTVQLWDPNTGAAVDPPLTGHQSSVYALAAVPIADGRVLLASAGDDWTVRLWDPNTGAAVGLPPIDHKCSVNALVAVPLADGRTLLASAGYDGTVRLWDPASGAVVGRPLTGHESSVDALVVVSLADGRILLASAGVDMTMRLWDPTPTATTPARIIPIGVRVSALCATRPNIARTSVGQKDTTVGGADLAVACNAGVFVLTLGENLFPPFS